MLYVHEPEYAWLMLGDKICSYELRIAMTDKIDKKLLDAFITQIAGNDELKREFYLSIHQGDSDYARKFQGARVDDKTMQIRMTM